MRNASFNQPALAGRLAAFTLVELLVVVVLLGIVGLMIIPRMGASISRREVVESAASFAHTARITRELAVARRQVFAVEVDAKGFSVEMRSVKDGSFTPVKVSWLRPQHWGDHVRLEGIKSPNGQAVTSESHKVEFREDGSSTGVMLHLASGKFDCGVLVDPASGRAIYGDRDTLRSSDEPLDLGD